MSQYPIAQENKDDLKSVSIDELKVRLKTSSDGLSQKDVEERLRQFGYNEIPEEKENPLLKFFAFFWGPIPWMIEAAAILSALVRHWPYFYIILVLLLANAVIGFWEEFQAGNAVDALKAKLAVRARVKRDSRWTVVPSRELVSMIVLIVPFFQSCATNDQFMNATAQINDADKRISLLENKTDKTTEAIEESTVAENKKWSDIDSNQAQLRIEMDQVKDEIEQLSNSLEENVHNVKSGEAMDVTQMEGLRKDVDNLSSRLSKIEASVGQMQTYLNINTGQTGSSVQTNPEAAVAPGPQTNAIQKTDEQQMFNYSISLYNKEQYNDAMTGFKNFLALYPISDLADDAQFWIGECLMSLKDYDDAILAYEDVIKKYPKGDKVPGAMLRQAIAFLEINDTISSTVLLKKVIKQFPKSNEARIAQKKLETMK